MVASRKFAASAEMGFSASFLNSVVAFIQSEA